MVGLNMKQRPIYDENFYQNERETSAVASREVLKTVNDFFAARSVVDIGCGAGEWLSAYREMGVVDVLGIDGDYVDFSQLAIPRERFIPKDISQVITDIPDRYDLTISLEVAEHIDPSRVENYMENVTKFSDVVLFSAAIPWQGGTHHVNEQWPSYWVKKFGARGYIPIDCLRERIWSLENVAVHYRQNMMFFVKENTMNAEQNRTEQNRTEQNRTEQYSKLREQMLLGKTRVLDLVHPGCYMTGFKCMLRKRLIPAFLMALKRRLPKF
jgi:cyclopropane fatty-acyl-phospholipid synthase-like methyltransferase